MRFPADKFWQRTLVRHIPRLRIRHQPRLKGKFIFSRLSIERGRHYYRGSQRDENVTINHLKIEDSLTSHY